MCNTQQIRLIQRLGIGALCLAALGATGQIDAPSYDALYCFGFSWTDTRGRACNGAMWPEFVSTNLGLSYLQANNLAAGGATTSATLAQVNQLNPPHAARSLFVAWIAAGDVLFAADRAFGSEINWTNETAWSRMFDSVLKTSSNIVLRLYAKGARSIVIQNCLDVSLCPAVIRDYDGNTQKLAKLKERTQHFNSDLGFWMHNLMEKKSDLRLFTVDVFSQMNEVYANPSLYGFTKVFPDVERDPALKDKSKTGPGKYYMFWDGLHGTSKLQELVAAWTLAALTNSVPESLQMEKSSRNVLIEMNHLLPGRRYNVESSRDLLAWTIGDVFSAESGTNRWAALLTNSSQFYRLSWK